MPLLSVQELKQVAEDFKVKITEMLLDRFSSIKDPVQLDWYRGILAVAIDDNPSDPMAAIAQADAVFISRPRPPKEPVQ